MWGLGHDKVLWHLISSCVEWDDKDPLSPRAAVTGVTPQTPHIWFRFLLLYPLLMEDNKMLASGLGSRPPGVGHADAVLAF